MKSFSLTLTLIQDSGEKKTSQEYCLSALENINNNIPNFLMLCRDLAKIFRVSSSKNFSAFYE